jgi:hypothetical protein
MNTSPTGPGPLLAELSKVATGSRPAGTAAPCNCRCVDQPSLRDWFNTCSKSQDLRPGLFSVVPAGLRRRLGVLTHALPLLHSFCCLRSLMGWAFPPESDFERRLRTAC